MKKQASCNCFVPVVIRKGPQKQCANAHSFDFKISWYLGQLQDTNCNLLLPSKSKVFMQTKSDGFASRAIPSCLTSYHTQNRILSKNHVFRVKPVFYSRFYLSHRQGTPVAKEPSVINEPPKRRTLKFLWCRRLVLSPSQTPQKWSKLQTPQNTDWSDKNFLQPRGFKIFCVCFKTQHTSLTI